MSVRVLVGDCLDVLPTLESDSADGCVTDPPYELGFMGRAWDRSGVSYQPETWAAVLRVARPGAYLLAAGSPRTYHRLACAIEDAGWVLTDCIQHIHGQGFPKGRGQMKPAYEPWTLARKPAPRVLPLQIDAARIALGDERPYATPGNGRGGVNVYSGGWAGNYDGAEQPSEASIRHDVRGRWPANVAFSHADDCRETGVRRVRGIMGGTERRTALGIMNDDAWQPKPTERTGYTDADGMETVAAWDCAPECPVALLDAQSERSTSSAVSGCRPDIRGGRYASATERRADTGAGYGDTGGASRFFYCAKADRAERDAGCDHLDRGPLRWSSGDQNPGAFQADGTDRSARNHHPTVKPLGLMRWLVRLVTPPGGLVLDPFAGSGSTGCAAVAEGFRFLGIEREAAYAEIAAARIAYWAERPAARQPGLFGASDMAEAAL